MPPSIQNRPLPLIQTRQLQTAVQNAAFIEKHGEIGINPDTKEDGLLKLKNVYISKGEVHVSKSGFRSAWARLWGKPTGAAALREAMLSYKIPEEKIEQATENLSRCRDKANPELIRMQIR